MDEHDNPSSLNDLESRIREARERELQPKGGRGGKRGGMSGAGAGLQIAVELVAGVMIGVGIGYGLDLWLGTKPWLMVVFLFLGGAAGVMNVYRTVKGMDQAVGLGRAERQKHDES